MLVWIKQGHGSGGAIAFKIRCAQVHKSRIHSHTTWGLSKRYLQATVLIIPYLYLLTKYYRLRANKTAINRVEVLRIPVHEDRVKCPLHREAADAGEISSIVVGLRQIQIKISVSSSIVLVQKISMPSSVYSTDQGFNEKFSVNVNLAVDSLYREAEWQLLGLMSSRKSRDKIKFYYQKGGQFNTSSVNSILCWNNSTTVQLSHNAYCRSSAPLKPLGNRCG